MSDKRGHQGSLEGDEEIRKNSLPLSMTTFLGRSFGS